VLNILETLDKYFSYQRKLKQIKMEHLKTALRHSPLKPIPTKPQSKSKKKAKSSMDTHGGDDEPQAKLNKNGVDVKSEFLAEKEENEDQAADNDSSKRQSRNLRSFESQ
jgi:hypothetical protein